MISFICFLFGLALGILITLVLGALFAASQSEDRWRAFRQ